MNTRALILFNERVDRLDRSSLAERMANPHYQLDYNRMINREWISADGVTEDDVDAFILNVRLLVQDGDGISVRELATSIYSDSNVPRELQDQFAKDRQRWRNHIDENSVIGHLTEKRNFTTGELFDLLLYGGIAHVNPNKVEMFYRLTRQGMYSTMVCASFLVSLRHFLDVVRSIRATNVALLEHIGC